MARGAGAPGRVALDVAPLLLRRATHDGPRDVLGSVRYRPNPVSPGDARLRGSRISAVRCLLGHELFLLSVRVGSALPRWYSLGGGWRTRNRQSHTGTLCRIARRIQEPTHGGGLATRRRVNRRGRSKRLLCDIGRPGRRADRTRRSCPERAPSCPGVPPASGSTLPHTG